MCKTLMRPLRNGLLLILSTGILCGFTARQFLDRQETPVSITNTPAAPIEPMEAVCAMLVSRATPAQRVGIVPFAAVNQVVGWTGRMKYRNRGNRSVTAVRFQWKLFDAFDHLQGTIEVTDDGRLPPGQIHEREWEQPASQVEVARAVVMVGAVRFENGTLWNGAADAKEDPTVGAALHKERERLLKLYREQGLNALLKALQEK